MAGGDCLVQLYSKHSLQHGGSIRDAAARLALQLSHQLAKRHGYKQRVYSCDNNAYCSKPPTLGHACFVDNCSYIFYVDSDVLIHDTSIDIIADVRSNYPDAAVTLGLDYRSTMLNPKWKDGQDRWYRTDSNAGMSVINCQNHHARRIIESWTHLCRRFSPKHSDQAANITDIPGHI